MSERDTDLPLTCQLGECRNRAALTVTVELPTSWDESREYNVRTLLVAACGECAPELEACGRGLLEGRVRYAKRAELVAENAHLMELLLMLISSVGPPFEPVQGSVFATWLTKLDKPGAQAAWRLLAHVKRTAMEVRRTKSGRVIGSSPPPERGRRDQTANRPLSIETARFRRRIVVPPIDPGPPAPPPSRGGSDDAA